MGKRFTQLKYTNKGRIKQVENAGPKVMATKFV